MTAMTTWTDVRVGDSVRRPGSTSWWDVSARNGDTLTLRLGNQVRTGTPDPDAEVEIAECGPSVAAGVLGARTLGVRLDSGHWLVPTADTPDHRRRFHGERPVPHTHTEEIK